MRHLSCAAGLLLGAFLLTTNANAHCQIPCGIYTDNLRFEMIEEHVTTIEKSMQQIIDLSAQSPINYNQLVRWIENKETHAEEIQDIVNAYFLTQRIKPVDAGDAENYQIYVEQVVLLQRMLVAAMKCKQTTDVAHTEELRSLSAQFQEAYAKAHGHKH